MSVTLNITVNSYLHVTQHHLASNVIIQTFRNSNQCNKKAWQDSSYSRVFPNVTEDFKMQPCQANSAEMDQAVLPTLPHFFQSLSVVRKCQGWELWDKSNASSAVKIKKFRLPSTDASYLFTVVEARTSWHETLSRGSSKLQQRCRASLQVSHFCWKAGPSVPLL